MSFCFYWISSLVCLFYYQKKKKIADFKDPKEACLLLARKSWKDKLENEIIHYEWANYTKNFCLPFPGAVWSQKRLSPASERDLLPTNLPNERLSLVPPRSSFFPDLPCGVTSSSDFSAEQPAMSSHCLEKRAVCSCTHVPQARVATITNYYSSTSCKQQMRHSNKHHHRQKDQKTRKAAICNHATASCSLQQRTAACPTK